MMFSKRGEHTSSLSEDIMRNSVETHLHYWHRDLTPHQVESLEQLVYYHASASAWPVVRVDTDDDVVVVKHLAGIPL